MLRIVERGFKTLLFTTDRIEDSPALPQDEVNPENFSAARIAARQADPVRILETKTGKIETLPTRPISNTAPPK